jgi:enoyl-CoA hydratase/carnithine racemase
VASGEPEVLYELSGPVATLTINRPERRNALSTSVLGKLRESAETARDDPQVRVLVLTGAGEKAFSAGADLIAMSPERDATAVHDERGELPRLMKALWSLGKPTIARVRGYALAGGFGVALSCDFVVSSDDAVFATPELDLGLWPYMITVPLLRSMAPKKALELMLTCRRVGADEALAIGFVNRVVPAAELDDAVAELAGALAGKPPTAMRLGRDAFYTVLDMKAEEALALLQPLLTITAQGDEASEGLAAFAEKRPPRWRA